MFAIMLAMRGYGSVGILLYVNIGAFVIAGILWVINRKELDKINNPEKPKDETLKDTNNAWKCSECGEQVEPNFDKCWNCGKLKRHDNLA